MQEGLRARRPFSVGVGLLRALQAAGLPLSAVLRQLLVRGLRQPQNGSELLRRLLATVPTA